MNLTRLHERDHYQVLDVSYDADADQIQRAYDEAREMYGHDALVAGTILSDEERRSTFHRISEAYQTLIRAASRESYDRDIGVERPSSSRSRGEPPARDLGARESRSHSRSAERSSSLPENVAAKHTTDKKPMKLGAEHLVSPIQLGLTEEATGAFLRRARETLGVDLASISEETKIGRSMLEYIEQERLDRLPAPIYLRNFTGQIAKCLGLDAEKVSRTYLARIRRLLANPE